MSGDDSWLAPLPLQPFFEEPTPLPPEDVPWCPVSPPAENHSEYWALVARLQSGAVPADLLAAATMELSGAYTDDDAVGDYFRDAGLTPAALPDMTHLVYDMPFWGKLPKESPDLPWLKLISQCLPNPCRARAFKRDLKKRLLNPATATAMRDLVLRAVGAAMLDTYGDGARPCVRAQMMIYAALSLSPPGADELCAFADTAHSFLLFALRRLVYFAVEQVPAVHGFLCERYKWQRMADICSRALVQVREAMLERGVNPSLLSDREFWGRMHAALAAHNTQSLSHCYRATDRPFHDKVIAEYERLARASRHKPTPTTGDMYAAFMHVARFQAKESLTRELIDSLPIEHEAFAKVRSDYTSERRPTAVFKFLPKIADTPLYNKVFALFKAVQHRLAFRWAQLPYEWAASQVRALGSIDAGLWYVCPKCHEVRANIIEYPAGQDERVRERALFPDGLALRTHGTEEALCCRKKRLRQHDAAAKRCSQSQRKHDDDPIDVCSGIRVVPVNMVGILLFVSRWVVLCVDCGAIMAWTPEAVTADGPSCGCQIQEALRKCALCQKPMARYRTHPVLCDTGVEEISVCRSHHTRYLDKYQVVPTFDQLQEAVRDRKHIVEVDGSFIWVERQRK